MTNRRKKLNADEPAAEPAVAPDAPVLPGDPHEENLAATILAGLLARCPSADVEILVPVAVKLTRLLRNNLASISAPQQTYSA